MQNRASLLVDNGRRLQVPEIEESHLTILATRNELIVLRRECNRVDLALVGYDLLILHCIEVPDRADTVQLRNCEHVGLVGAPVEAGNGGVVGANRAA